MLSAPSAAVVYECAGTLVSLSSAPSAIRAAASTYCQLLLSQSDNVVKLIVLDRLNELKSSHREIMVETIMDVLRALSSPNLEIRRKTIDIALELITPRNIDGVVLLLKKEVMKTQGGELEKNGEYRQMLVQAIHSCAIKFPEVASTVVMDFLGDSNVASAIDVCLGELPFYTPTEEGESQDTPRTSQQANSMTVLSRRPAILVDGTYATQSAASERAMSTPMLAQGPLASVGNLRSLIVAGDFSLGAVVACTLTKLALIEIGRGSAF
ncbi:hypothetical protein RHGRI_004359 [Rhododendron griersonianum]|uniref:Clathrin/coatomer adaptor adaptin-like N-terminal domain-containing protein n=1 Tax=Rhododendron griersonianum TaxID=479676 RepID=A0AAV6L8B7_9ERIC|nr:hypothetical protein RHGRI_004359 [Rhododendron griersonianum]